MSRLRHTALAAVSLAVFFAGWWAAVRWRWVPYLAGPDDVVRVLAAEGPELLAHTWATAVRAVAGFAIGAAVGVLLPLAMGWQPYLSAALQPLVHLARPTPLVALIPLFLLWFGIGELAEILLVAVGSFFILVVVTLESIRNVPSIYVWAGAALGASRGVIYRRVVFPAVVPGIIGGLLVALTFAFPLTVAAEMMGAQRGLGYYLWQMVMHLQVARMIAVTVLLTALVVASDQAVRAMDRRLTAWSERRR